MTSRSLIVLALVLGACGGRQEPVPTGPVPEAAAAVQEFMRGVADSNLALMAQHWGTSRGPAAETGTPSDYQKRIVIMQAYLRGTTFRILSDTPVPGERGRRVLNVELTRAGCVNVVPFTVVRTGRGQWLVNQFNLEQVGAPTRGCAPPGNG